MKSLVLAIGLCLFSAAASAQDHGHLNVGSSGAALTWDNGADFDPATAYVKTLTFTNAAKYAGFYQGNITLTAMHAFDPFGERDPAAPLLGAFIEAEIVSVEGPEGGAFAFWENTSTAGNPTVSIPAGATNAGFRFPLSEEALGAGQPNADPYGHIHGRRMTATLPGIYRVGFRAHDISNSGPEGGPLHSASGVQYVDFQAGVVLADVEVDAATGSVRLGAMAGYSWQLQTATDLPPNWTDAGAPVAGNDAFVTIEDGLPRAPRRFYRAVGTPLAP